MNEIGRVDIATDVSMLSSFLAMPRVGHLEEAINIMVYFRLHRNSRLVLDPTYPVLDHSSFNDGAELAEFYGDATKAIPLNMPEPRGEILTYVLCVIVITQGKNPHVNHILDI